MLARLPNDFCLSLLENDLIPEDAVKDLRLTLGRNLSLDDYIVKVTASCMSILEHINRVKHVFNLELFIRLVVNIREKYQETPIHPEFCRTHHQWPWCI